MKELVEAYQYLMDDSFGEKLGSSRVATACEIYTIEELRADNVHDVHSIRVIYEAEQRCDSGEDLAMSQEISSTSFVEVMAHPDDSVSDLKRELQNQFSSEWDLDNRQKDRDGVALGWEVVTENNRSVLSYHLFLHSYAIKDGDILHAVIRKHKK